MNHYSIISPDEFVSMPWKNGLGHTVEIIKEDSRDQSGFAWRLSMADVATDGEFSNFKGYDRTLLLLEGNGMTLEHQSGQRDVLEKPLQAARFRGDEQTVAELHNGPIKDFNVMTLRSHCSADVLTGGSSDSSTVNVNADVLLIYAVGGGVLIASQDIEPVALPDQHLFVARQPNKELVNCSGAAYIATQITYQHIEHS